MTRNNQFMEHILQIQHTAAVAVAEQQCQARRQSGSWVKFSHLDVRLTVRMNVEVILIYDLYLEVHSTLLRYHCEYEDDISEIFSFPQISVPTYFQLNFTAKRRSDINDECTTHMHLLTTWKKKQLQFAGFRPV